MTWTEVEGATAYNLYYGDQLLGAAEGTGAKISVDEAGAEYCFTVTAFNEAGESEHSNEVCVTTHPDGVEENEATFNIYPNPVVSEATINFNVAETSTVSYQIYDLAGRMVQNATLGNYNQGSHSVNFNVNGLTTGSYIVKVQAGSATKIYAMEGAVTSYVVDKWFNVTLKVSSLTANTKLQFNKPAANTLNVYLDNLQFNK